MEAERASAPAAAVVAAVAERSGLVSRVVPDAELLSVAMGIAEKVAANPPYAVRMCKRLMRQSQESSLAAVLEMSAAMQALAHETAEHEERIKAFLDRRKAESKDNPAKPKGKS